MIKVVNLILGAISSSRIAHVSRWAAPFALSSVPSMINLPLIDDAIAVVQVGIVSLEDAIDPPLDRAISAGRTAGSDDIGLDRIPCIWQ